ncbi:hypothetical protein GYA27_00405 [candidate division WWE3 bacterium]|uniref:Glycosyltransferase RgtA/B/C/D-like domain-containing protein n=1 Tax=candidate division WWE3 bacterium TaxID=2053526 RepID=A0A7X9HGT5_UNCKA|nr:hypothetical protein [candidate division WWE3 bacterium]
MFTAIKNNRHLLAVIVAFLLFVVIVGVKGNFPTNDDWYFVRQVKAFDLGIFKLHAKVLPIFIVQGFLGLLWGTLFGIGFDSLRILTLLVTLFSGIILYRTILLVTPQKRLAGLGMFIYLFNPIVLSSAFTFMTENYYLLFMVCSVYFAVKFFNLNRTKEFYLALLFMLLTSLVRQTGLFLFLAFFAAASWKNVKNISWRKTLFFFFSLTVTILLIVFWPRYQTSVIDKSINLSSGYNVILERLSVYLLAIPMLVFWISPLFIIKKPSVGRLFDVSVLTWLFSYIVFRVDIFPLGSVFYFESLHIKSGFRHSLSIFDNVPAKIVMSVYLGLLISVSAIYVFNKIKKIHINNRVTVFLWLCVVGVLTPILLTPTVYDRYFTPLIVFTVLLLIPEIKSQSKIFTLGILIFAFISVVNVYEFIIVKSLKHKLYESLLADSTVNVTERDIYIDDTYSKYLYAEEQEDYAGRGQNLPVGLVHKCFIQQYTIDGPFTLFIKNLEDKVEKRIKNPSVYGSTPPIRNIRISKHLNELNRNEMYFSPLYSIIGKTAFVGSWCDK